MSESFDQNRREPLFAGWVIRPQAQFRFVLFAVGGTMAAQSLLVLLFLHFSQVRLATIMEDYQVSPIVIDAVGVTLHDFLLIMFLISFAFACFVAAASLRLSHRFYGPLVPIRRFITQLNAGDFSARLALRKNDELSELKDALNTLAQTLESSKK